MAIRALVGLLAIAFTVASLVAGEPAQTARPNVLFLAVDDLRPELGCYGAKEIKSPNIDRLAQTGVLFTRAYCQQAVCGATRNSLLSGLRPDTTRIYDNLRSFRKVFPELVALPQQFKDHGYHSVGMGKIYHQNDPLSWSEPWIDVKAMDWLAPDSIAIRQKRAADAKAQGLKGTKADRASRGPAFEAADVPDDAYGEGQLATHAIEKLRAMAGRPFFLAVGMYRPHLPFNCPKKYWDLYNPNTISLPAHREPPKNCPEVALTEWGEMRSYAGIPKAGPVTEEQARSLIHGYHACVSYTDAQIGRILDELDRLGLADNTIVILWGDHGWKLGDYGMWCKHTNFEIDTHVPLIVRAPGAKGNGRRAEGLVEFVDIYPTLCDLAGLPLPEHLEGKSFAPVLDEPARPGKETAMSQYPRGKLMGCSMRTERYRLTLWVDNDRRSEVQFTELYDFVADPDGTVNLAAEPAHANLVEELTAKLRANW
ncbi:MAG: sulfatase [Planctomycetota bacterium]